MSIKSKLKFALTFLFLLSGSSAFAESVDPVADHSDELKILQKILIEHLRHKESDTTGRPSPKDEKIIYLMLLYKKLYSHEKMSLHSLENLLEMLEDPTTEKMLRELLRDNKKPSHAGSAHKPNKKQPTHTKPDYNEDYSLDEKEIPTRDVPGMKFVYDCKLQKNDDFDKVEVWLVGQEGAPKRVELAFYFKNKEKPLPQWATINNLQGSTLTVGSPMGTITLKADDEIEEHLAAPGIGMYRGKQISNEMALLLWKRSQGEAERSFMANLTYRRRVTPSSKDTHLVTAEIECGQYSNILIKDSKSFNPLTAEQSAQPHQPIALFQKRSDSKTYSTKASTLLAPARIQSKSGEQATRLKGRASGNL